MKFLKAIPVLLFNVVGSFATTVELSRDGLPKPHHRRSQEMVEELTNLVVQTYYIPFPEDIMFNEFFLPLNVKATKGNAMSIIAMSISTDNTIIWYDHWEDGYDADVTNATTRHVRTEVWGDGNATNGCQPTIPQGSCTDDNDKLMAGRSFVIQNERLPPFRDPLVYKYDGSDKVCSNFPIAITRGGYPTRPGSELAGAMEVLDTSRWGTHFIAPVGNGTSTLKASFEFSAYLVMAMEANTTLEVLKPVSLGVESTYTLNEGESRLISVRLNQQLKASKLVQVAMITGDIDSLYESRWYSLLDLPQWSSQYVTPTGETFGKTKLWLYNPNTFSMTVQMETRTASGGKVLQNLRINARSYTLSPHVKDQTGAIVTASGSSAGKNFMAFSITDAERKSSDGVTTEGQMYDWGFPVQPLNDLTSQVLIAWGYGCTNNACGTDAPRSVVWITPVEDATIYIDYQNSGNFVTRNAKRLESIKITDPVDKDMSGAMIFGVIANGSSESRPVNIAASWGQDPVVSKPKQDLSLDLGTTILPFFNIMVNKVVDKEYVSPDEYLIYTIRVYNLGQSRINARMILLKDTLDPWVTYVPNSMTAAIVNTTYIQAMADDATGTAFPLDGSGALIPFKLDPRGGMVDVTFEVKLKPASVIQMATEDIINKGTMSGNSLPTIPFEAISYVVYEPNITLTNTVYLGNDATGSSCLTAVEYVEGFKDTDVVYCFTITNNGHTFLSNVMLQDGNLTYTTNVGILAPGASRVVPFVSSITSNLTNTATVIGNPTFRNGTDIPDLSDVNATDPSAVGILPFLPNITITNTVYLGGDNTGASCSSAVEYVEDYKNANVVYCFNITNAGNTHLGNITLTDGALAYTNTGIVSLAPGESILIPFVSSILSNLTNNAVVVGNPVLPNGADIADLSDVTATDPSSVGLLSHLPSITLTNTVYLGGDSEGASCSSAVEYVEDYKNANVVYCFNITNAGNTHLGNITLTDGALAYTNTGIVSLAPGESILIPFVSSILSNLTNNAVVVGNPVLPNGADIADLSDVTATDPSSVGLLSYSPSITLTNTVYLGGDSEGASCSSAVEYVEDYKNANVVYCFNITNNGNTYLDNITLTNVALEYASGEIVSLAPGESVLIPCVMNITSNLANSAIVKGNPCLKNGTDIPELNDVTDTDPSAVGMLAHTANITLTNTVYIGDDITGASCASAVEFVEGYNNTYVVYCFNISNNGNTHLSNITLVDSELKYSETGIVTLAPGESVMIPFVSSITSSLANNAVVVGNPVLPNGNDIAELEDVTATDPSSVGLLKFSANITITNTVYVGSDSTGASCSDAVEFVQGINDTKVVYCFNITNTGETHLSAVTLTNVELSINMPVDITTLAPGESVLVPFVSSILFNLTNIASVTSNPVFANGTEIPDMEDVTATDPSEVGIIPPRDQTCLQDSWNETYIVPRDDLICTTKEVFIESMVSKPITCVLGSQVNVSVSAFISIASTRSDVGWFIAADGGDALEGNCIVEGLEEGYVYHITNTSFGDEVTWLHDECGDVTINGTGAVLEVPTFVHATILCADENKDNKIDLSVCFSWNKEDTDSLCSITSSKLSGASPHLYPGDSSMCYCESYNIPNSTVVDPNDDVVPCS